MSAQSSQSLRLEVSLSTLAREFGIARETVTKRMAAAGVGASGKDKRGNNVFFMGDAARAIIAAEYGGVNVVKDPDHMQPKEQLDHYKAQNEKIKFDREKGRLVDEADHRDVIAALVKPLIQQIETLPDLLERNCNLMPAELELVESAMNTARNDLADELEKYELR